MKNFRIPLLTLALITVMVYAAPTHKPLSDRERELLGGIRRTAWHLHEKVVRKLQTAYDRSGCLFHKKYTDIFILSLKNKTEHVTRISSGETKWVVCWKHFIIIVIIVHSLSDVADVIC